MHTLLISKSNFLILIDIFQNIIGNYYFPLFFCTLTHLDGKEDFDFSQFNPSNHWLQTRTTSYKFFLIMLIIIICTVFQYVIQDIIISSIYSKYIIYTSNHSSKMKLERNSHPIVTSVITVGKRNQNSIIN